MAGSDRFKIVNDTLGHPIGDALLRGVALRLGSVANATDVLVRLGGNEFALVRADDDGPRLSQSSPPTSWTR